MPPVFTTLTALQYDGFITVEILPYPEPDTAARKQSVSEEVLLEVKMRIERGRQLQQTGEWAHAIVSREFLLHCRRACMFEGIEHVGLMFKDPEKLKTLV